MSRVIVIEERCKGCLLCTTVCPAGLPSQSNTFNRQGYQVVGMGDSAECKGCAACAMICPDVALRVLRTRKSKKETAA